jgi:nucleoside-diphosphate-sugar epimerase
MVIGNGLMASSFKEYIHNDDVLIFASGVSNSLETNMEPLFREAGLLSGNLKRNKNKLMVYFSSCVNLDENKKMYMDHKLHMEEIIKKSKNRFIILRLPQVIGNGGNPNTLVNFIVNKLKNNEKLDIYKGVSRSLIDVEDVKRIIDEIILEENYGTFNLYHIELVRIEYLVNLIAKRLNIVPNINLIDGPMNVYSYNSHIFESLLRHLHINYYGYTESLIEKYIK